MRTSRSMKLLTVGALLLPMGGMTLAGCVVHEKERVVERPRARAVVVEERPRVIERDTTVIERR